MVSLPQCGTFLGKHRGKSVTEIEGRFLLVARVRLGREQRPQVGEDREVATQFKEKTSWCHDTY